MGKRAVKLRSMVHQIQTSKSQIKIQSNQLLHHSESHTLNFTLLNKFFIYSSSIFIFIFSKIINTRSETTAMFLDFEKSCNQTMPVKSTQPNTWGNYLFLRMTYPLLYGLRTVSQRSNLRSSFFGLFFSHFVINHFTFKNRLVYEKPTNLSCDYPDSFDFQSTLDPPKQKPMNRPQVRSPWSPPRRGAATEPLSQPIRKCAVGAPPWTTRRIRKQLKSGG